MASIIGRKNKDGQVTSWQVKVRRVKNGQVTNTTKSFTKRRDAEMWAHGIESEVSRGAFVSREEAESTTLAEALQRYHREVTPRKRGAEREAYRITYLLEHVIAKRSLAAVRGSDVALLRDDRAARGLAASTIVKELALLSHLFEIARKEWGIEVVNPVKNISKPKVDNARERRLTPNEERYLLAALDDPGDAVRTKTGDRRNTSTPLVVRFAIETAARQSEILSLDWADVDLERAVCRLRGVGGGVTKNDEKYRDIPLSRAAVSLLRGDGEVVKLRRGKVFQTTASAIKQSFTRAVARGRRLYRADCEKAGQAPENGFLVDLTFHDLRHEAISRLAEKLQMHELMKVSGHKDSRMLARYYHPRAEDLAKKLG